MMATEDLVVLDAPREKVRELTAAEIGLETARGSEGMAEEDVESIAEHFALEPEEVQRWIAALGYKRQAIIYGPPGTGKTELAKSIAEHIVEGTDGFVKTIQFHPSSSYEDFIQGIRPSTTDDGDLIYDWEDGTFLQFCDKAENHEDRCVLIIDEINRANIPEVFGELMLLLEHREEEITLPGGRNFSPPENVRLIGTMNTADQSIALLDYAFRRRFAFIPLWPNFELLRSYHDGTTDVDPEGLISVLKKANGAINDRNREIGVTYFLDPELETRIEAIWRTEIEPYLEECFFEDPDRMTEFRWGSVKGEIGI